MNPFTALGVRLKAAYNAFTSMTWGSGNTGRAWWHWNQHGTSSFNYGRYVGDGRGNSIVQSVLGWEARKFPEAHLALRRKKADGSTEQIVTHPFLDLLERPNDFYNGETMVVAALMDRRATGNGYILKLRSAAERVVQLWYVPQTMIEPYWSQPDHFIDAYKYTPDGSGAPIYLRPKDVIHLRLGIDPKNVRLGLSPIGSLTREIFTDEEAGNYTAALLRNVGVPPVVVSPDGDTEITPDDAEGIKLMMDQRFGGDNRGNSMVLSSKVKVERVSMSPTELDLSGLRDLPEERVTGVLGVPAIVAGMGAGLAQSAYANVTTLREVAVEDYLLPTYRLVAADLRQQLLPDFAQADLAALEVYFDTGDIRELQEDVNKLHEREALGLRSGGITIEEYRAATGRDPLPTDGTLLIPATAVPTPVASLGLVPEPVPAPTPPVQGAGYDDVEMKALGVLRGIEALRARLQDSEARTLRTMLRSQLDLTLAVLSAGKAADELETKALDIGAVLGRLEGGFKDAVGTVLRNLHLRAIESTYHVVSAGLDQTIDVDPRIRQRLLREAGANVQGITDTTLTALRNTIRASQRADESLDELTARIRGLGVFADSRAETIARTELGIATNRASIEAYDGSGIVRRVRIHDGTEHDAECASLAGRVVTLAEARAIPPLGHPSCVRRFESLIESTRALGNGHIGEFWDRSAFESVEEPTIGLCRECLFWTERTAEEYIRPPDIGERQGDCYLAQSHNGDAVHETKAYASDGEAWAARLLTDEDFGCVQFEERAGREDWERP